MPNILQVTKDEIIWQLSGSSINAGQQANTRIKDYLGDDARFFAPMTATTKGFTWTSQEVGWKPLASASDSQRYKVASELESLRTIVRQKLSSNPKLADAVLSLPNDEGKYIFFKEEGEGIRILVAGWGFSNSRRKVVIPDNNKIDESLLVNAKLGFTIKGELQPSHKFYITTVSGNSKECFTDADGFYHLGQQKAGTKVELLDADSRKSISFTIEKGTTDYLFDVTRIANVCVRVFGDGRPMADVRVDIGYHGSTDSYITDSFGEVKISVPYFDNEMIDVAIRGVDGFEPAENRAACNFPDTLIELQLQKHEEVPLPPEYEYRPVSVRCVNQNGEPRQGYPITVEIDQDTSNYLTDNDGTIRLPAQKTGTYIKVMDGCDSSNSSIWNVGDSDNVIELIVPEQMPIVPDNILQMIGIDGKPLAYRDVILRQGHNTLTLGLDAEGRTGFKSDTFECGKEMSAQVIDNNEGHDAIPFTLEEDEHEYVIIEAVSTKSPWWHSLLNILLLIALICAIALLGAYFVNYLPVI